MTFPVQFALFGVAFPFDIEGREAGDSTDSQNFEIRARAPADDSNESSAYKFSGAASYRLAFEDSIEAKIAQCSALSGGLQIERLWKKGLIFFLVSIQKTAGSRSSCMCFPSARPVSRGLFVASHLCVLSKRPRFAWTY